MIRGETGYKELEGAMGWVASKAILFSLGGRVSGVSSFMEDCEAYYGVLNINHTRTLMGYWFNFPCSSLDRFT